MNVVFGNKQNNVIQGKFSWGKYVLRDKTNRLVSLKTRILSTYVNDTHNSRERIKVNGVSLTFMYTKQ